MPSSVDKWKVFFYSGRDTESKQDVFDEIWEQYHKRLFFFIRQMVGEDAEDLLQEITLKKIAQIVDMPYGRCITAFHIRR